MTVEVIISMPKRKTNVANIEEVNYYREVILMINEPIGEPLKIIISYDKLWEKMKERKLNKHQLRLQVPISSSSISKLTKNEPLTPKVIAKLCKFFNCAEKDILDIDFY